MNDLFNVKGKTIAITGGGGVLCGTMAIALGRAGAKIAVLDIIETTVGKVAEKIKPDRGKAIAIKRNFALQAEFLILRATCSVFRTS